MSSRPHPAPCDAVARLPALEGGPGHTLNNLLAKILGSAELALDLVSDPRARAHLQSVMTLAETGGAIVHELQASAPPRSVHPRRVVAGPDSANGDQADDAGDPNLKPHA